MVFVIGNGSNSDRYRVLSFNSESVRHPGVPSLFEAHMSFSLSEEVGTMGRRQMVRGPYLSRRV